jgi:DNA-binding NtrC family response regulator
VLIVEDDDAIRSALSEALVDLGDEVVAEPSAEAGLRAVERAQFDVVVTDFKLPGMDGIELCERLTGDLPNLPVVVMTAFGDVGAATGALRAGAFDFVTKPLSLSGLSAVIDRALLRGETAPIVVRLAVTPTDCDMPKGLIGESPQMLEVSAEVARAAATNSTVLVTGESGTGKELVARGIHDASSRSDGPFVAVSCAAFPAELLEAELFGHARGAFTGAVDARAGLFRQASGGTLFLDEVGDLPPELQPKLLRALQVRSARPVGETREVEFDVRLVAATNKNLERAVTLGEFRRDLCLQLNVIQIRLPPLRKRGSDVLMLARHFAERASGGDQRCEIAADAERLLLAYHWPGNVRELENCITAAAALASGGRIGFDELPTGVRERRAAGERTRLGTEMLEDVERRHIELVLRAVGGNKAEAARMLGINRATLYRKLARHGLERRSEET